MNVLSAFDFFVSLAILVVWLGSLCVVGFCLENRTGWMIFDSNRKVGGIRFIRLGRLNISISVSRNSKKEV